MLQHTDNEAFLGNLIQKIRNGRPLAADYFFPLRIRQQPRQFKCRKYRRHCGITIHFTHYDAGM